METRKSLPILLLSLALLAGPPALGKSAAVLLREGLYAEEMEGDLDAAIQIYQQIIDDQTAERRQVAQALYRQGMCHLKQKHDALAQTAFQKLVASYGDQSDLVEKVKPMLEELGNADPAALMPPGTLMYVEIGSPGRQVETVLNMLKDTPFENPLAALGAGQPAQQTGTANNPAAMVGRILNPSMMAEFKKIRGIGIGITDLKQDNPPVTVVLFPGQSDALRGIIQMVLGFVGQPAGAIEGIQTLAIADGGFVAYDDTVVILTSPSTDARNRLEWSVRQYKHATSAPTLASSNASFAKISKQARQQNALTVWLNVNEAYDRLQAMLPAEAMQQVKMADGMVDLKHIEDLIASLSLRETGMALEANLHFEEGHQSMAYNMIRTPHLNEAALKAVPPEAVALISVALGAPDTHQAAAFSQQMKNGMGLDIGPALFSNIKQITLFAIPPGKMVEPPEGRIPAVFNALGLAVTSDDPEQTRTLFTKLLHATNLLPVHLQGTDTGGGKYEFPLVNGQKIFAHMSRLSNTTVLSLSPSLVTASAAGLGGGASAVDNGRFGDALNTLTPATSKLVAINLAGALRFAAQNMDLASESAAEKVRTALNQVADASEKATIRLQTTEEERSFGVRLSVSDLPPTNEVIGPIMQIVETMEEVEAQQQAWQQQAAKPAGVAQAKRSPVIDGKLDNGWQAAPLNGIKNRAYASLDGDSDCSATFKAMWDEDNLYIVVNVNDETLRNDSDDFWMDDAVEIFIDADNAKSGQYGANDYRFHIGWDEDSPVMGEGHHGQTGGTDYAVLTVGGGYRTEVKLPWQTLGVRPAAGMKIGLDVHVNDDDNGGDRDTKLMWHGRDDNAWESPKAFGTAELQGLVAHWTFDETDGIVVADRAGAGHAGRVQGDPQWEPTGGKYGGALRFDGQYDYVKIDDESSFDIQGQVTVAAWVNLNAVNAEWTAIVTKGDTAWRLSTEEDDPAFHFGVQQMTWVNGNRRVGLNEWHHVAGVYDGQELRLYVDGRLDAQNAWTGGIGTNDYPVLIGENAQMEGRFFDGMLDDVRIYAHALSPEEVAALAAR